MPKERGPAGPVALVKSFSCPNCGAQVTIRSGGHTLNVVCDGCGSVIDAKDPNYEIVAQFDRRTRVKPKIPLGSRGKIARVIYEVVGMQVRTITVEGVPYSWQEYLLFNPYQGFRYLTEYAGHWNDVNTVRAVPEHIGGSKPTVRLHGTKYKHFQTARAKTTYVLGEFPWQVRAGDVVEAQDYVAPPNILSAEITNEEVTWSLGRYTPGAEIWKAFKLPGKPPSAEGVFANQPSPHVANAKGLWKLWLLNAAAILALAIFFAIVSAGEKVFDQTFTFDPRAPRAPFVTEPFELKGRPATVEVTLDTDLSNQWAYFNMALINDQSGQAFDFGREVSYYRDSEGSEGSPKDTSLLPAVPAGRYYLLIEPEGEQNANRVLYRVQVRRDVPAQAYYWLGAILLLIPPVMVTVRAMMFEGRRWQESDYASADSGDDD
jgi:hypothetical protein